MPNGVRGTGLGVEEDFSKEVILEVSLQWDRGSKYNVGEKSASDRRNCIFQGPRHERMLLAARIERHQYSESLKHEGECNTG